MKLIWSIVSTLMLLCIINTYAVTNYLSNYFLILIFIPIYIFINILPSFAKKPTFKLKMLSDGCDLLNMMLITSFVTAITSIYLLVYNYEDFHRTVFINAIIAIILEAIVFWNGIIRVYCTSVQLGIKKRVLGAMLGWIPIANVYFLIRIIAICMTEVKFETNKIKLNSERKDEELCKTKYPIVLIHGVFFRDWKYMNYWGRIPNELIKNGATIYYGDHQSALSIEKSAVEISEKIKEIILVSGAEKVNIIAHSKGGLDSRYAISKLGLEEYVASLTTINTPHRGCIFADYLFSKTTPEFVQSVADKYNSTLKILGDKDPDFTSAVKDLTASSCIGFNDEIIDSPNVYYQSIFSKQNKASNGKFPLNISYPLVKKFDGVNDGLVSVESAKWGDKFTILTVKGSRGISHADVIDLTKENVKGFDVREFYVNLVNELKNKGF